MTTNTYMALHWTKPDTLAGDAGGPARWLYRPRPVERPCQRLFCFPYAGGSPLLFRRWPTWLAEDIEVCAIVLPGRASRVDEPPSHDLLSLSRDIAGVIERYCDVPFAFFGHSLGAVLAFEVTRVLRERGVMAPTQLLVSARQAPEHAVSEFSALPAMSDAAILARLARLGGTPAEVLGNEQLMALLLPALKADFMALDHWHYRAQQPLRVPITAIAGSEDRSVCVDSVRRWSSHTTGEFQFHLLQGDHFFIHGCEQDLVCLVARALARATEVG